MQSSTINFYIKINLITTLALFHFEWCSCYALHNLLAHGWFAANSKSLLWCKGNHDAVKLLESSNRISVLFSAFLRCSLAPKLQFIHHHFLPVTILPCTPMIKPCLRTSPGPNLSNHIRTTMHHISCRSSMTIPQLSQHVVGLWAFTIRLSPAVIT